MEKKRKYAKERRRKYELETRQRWSERSVTQMVGVVTVWWVW
mgnify:CR=1 FL=1